MASRRAVAMGPVIAEIGRTSRPTPLGTRAIILAVVPVTLAAIAAAHAPWPFASFARTLVEAAAESGADIVFLAEPETAVFVLPPALTRTAPGAPQILIA